MRSLVLVAALALVPATVGLQAQDAAKPAKQRASITNGTMAISGLASAGRHCVTNGAASIHSLGWVPQNTQVTVTFVSDFDPVAAITLMQLGAENPTPGAARASLVSDDDTGGNLEPEIRFTTTHSGTMALHVKTFSNTEGQGCYTFKTEVRTP
jgi:hypothetical protein